MPFQLPEPPWGGDEGPWRRVRLSRGWPSFLLPARSLADSDAWPCQVPRETAVRPGPMCNCVYALLWLMAVIAVASREMDEASLGRGQCRRDGVLQAISPREGW